MEPDERYAGWCEDLDRLRAEIHELHLRTEVIEGIDEELVRTQRPGSGFVSDVFRRMYAESQAVRIRRLIDGARGTRSFVRLAGDMAKHSTVLTRARYTAPCKRQGLDALGDQDFDALAGEGAEHIPRGRLLELQAELREAGAVVKAYVDANIAHDDRDGEASLTWGQLKAAVEGVSKLYTRIGVILTSAYQEPVPVTTGEWREAFRDGLFND